VKDWWKSFFKPITSEVMFKPREGKQTQLEVVQVLKQLGNKRNLEILDLCCGEGRHSVLFAQKGHRVTGLDFTASYLKVARQRAAKAAVRIKFVKGDMKKTSDYFPKDRFDTVVSLYNSFGYFAKRSDDFRTLKEVRKVLRPGGYFVINTINGNGAKLRLEKPLAAGYEISKNLFMLDKASLDLKKMRTHSNWTVIDARKKKTAIFRGSFQQNIYTHQELTRMLRQAGFKVVKTWGPLQGGAFDEKKSWHQTLLAQKL
jgi:D-alanine-D-alanine ligase